MRLKFHNRFGLLVLGIAMLAAALMAGGGEQPNTMALALTAGSILLGLDLGCRFWQYRPEDDKILFLFAEVNGGQIVFLPVWIWGAIFMIGGVVRISFLVPFGLAIGIADVVYRLRQAYVKQESAWLALAPGGGTSLWIIGGLVALLPWWRDLPQLENPGDEQSPFFVYFLVLVIAMNLIRRYFGAKLRGQGASATDVQRSYENPVGLVVLRLLMLAMWVVILLYGFDQPRMRHFALALPDSLRWFGVGGAVASLLLLVWVHQSLGKNWSRLLQVWEEQTLVMHGPYQWVRHPMYTVLSAFYLCAVLVAANSLIGFVSLGIVLQFWTRIEPEEHMMIEHFGDAYRNYMQHTGRLLPRFRSE